MTATTASSRAWAYVDTSALVKRYVDEAGRREVQGLLSRHRVVASAVLTVELSSAFRRRTSDGSIDGKQAPRLAQRVAADRVYWTLVEVSAGILAAAERLVAHHPLRALDAIHVASAQFFASRAGHPDLVFVSADVRQAEVATAVGLKVRYIES
jgi:predicted nucleic acid-binding protein